MTTLHSVLLSTLVCSAYAFASRPFLDCRTIMDRSNKAQGIEAYTKLRAGDIADQNKDSKNIEFFTLEGGMCPYAARTLIVLHELGLPFDTVEVSGRPKPDWYLEINPRGKVPALRIPSDDNTIVYESAICDEYLCDHHDVSLGSNQ
eukprot:CAMPEP_0185738016 /NCGR_PEP_ID=MMETSP1171-20130828/31843_1 /TAXON_ID=374046 /ORGANISM="Helicotheca tamensis, Strain CCMP826" /LENGTH=146 /DNA_ID=CAMNT_0028409103 /DNA_START=33 /DNA_END=470 /DNA_ORIENTATION=+